MRILVIANPISGAGRGRREAERLVPLLEARGHAGELALTTAAGDARQLAARAGGDPPDRIVVVGGDGTLNEVVNGLDDPGAIPLAQLGVGTANMLARELAVPRNAGDVAEVIEGGALHPIDVGRANGQRFLMNVSCGFDAMVVQAIRERRSGTLGFHAYVVPTLKTLWRYREPHLTVRLDGGEAQPAGVVIVSSLRNYGGLFAVADSARLDSGDFTVCLFQRARRRDLVRYILGAFLRPLARLRGVTIARATRIEVTSPEPVAVQIDGDYVGTSPLEIEVEKTRARIAAPPASTP